MEDGYDSDGRDFRERKGMDRNEKLTGSSGDWNKEKVSLPADTNYIRFTYSTDGSTNKRGWYVDDVKVNHSALPFTSDEWIKRQY